MKTLFEALPEDPAAFIAENTRLRPVPLVPEISLHVADEAVPLWEKTEEELGEIGLPPPFWAFAWAGGQALARYLLDNPDLVAGRNVLDFASGSGLVAIAAMRAGARSVVATDVDAMSAAAIRLNARVNAVDFQVDLADVTGREAGGFGLICVGDAFYEAQMADKATLWLVREKMAGTDVLIGDPERSYLPRERLTKLTEYSVPVIRSLEDAEIKKTSVWSLNPNR